MTQASRIDPRSAQQPPCDAQEASAESVRLMVRLAFGQHGALGPGKIQLLELIDKHGSITAACREMGMSYRRAWLLVEGMKRAFREAVLTTQQGGASGGGCRLTSYGRSILARYRALERHARDAVGEELHAFEQELLLTGKAPAPILARRRRTRNRDDAALAACRVTKVNSAR